MKTHTLEIAHTWDGVPLWPKARTSLELRTTFDSLVLTVDAPFYNDPPPDAAVGSTDGLWNYEVVEFFLSGPSVENGDIPYLEVELSPHGHFLVLQLLGIRERHQIMPELSFSAEIQGDRWHGEAAIPREWLPPGPHRCNAYAVRGQAEHRHYMAMKPVPGEEPDFHRVMYFVPITLEFEAGDE